MKLSSYFCAFVVGLVIVMVEWGFHGRIQAAEVMYWVNAGNVETANTDGTNRQVVYQSGGQAGLVNCIAADIPDGKMYYYGLNGNINTGTPFVKRSNFDGTQMETVITGTVSTIQYGFSIDSINRKMYLGDHYGLWVANLDGSNLKEYLPVPHNPWAQRMYPHSITVDNIHSKLYYTNDINWWGPGFYGVGRVDLATGQDLEIVVDTGNTGSTHVALDLSNGELYFSSGNATIGSGSIGKAALDGTNIETLIPNITAYSISIDATMGKLYWIGLDKIQCANLDGTNVQDVLTLTTSGAFVSGELILTPEPSSLLLLIAGWGSLLVRRQVN